MEASGWISILAVVIIVCIAKSKKKTVRRPGGAKIQPPAPPVETQESVVKPKKPTEKPMEELHVIRNASAKSEAGKAVRGKLTAQDMRRAFVMSEILREPVSVRDDNR